MSDVRGLVLDCMTLISANGCWLDNFTLTEGILYSRVSEVCWLDNFALTEGILYRWVSEVKGIVWEGT